MKTNTLFQVRFKPSVKPPRGFTKSAHYNVLSYDWHNHKYLIGNTWLHASNFIKIKVEDAPVFNKPVLRKIASLKPDEVIECNTDAELKAVLEQAEREGLVWFNKKKPTEHIPTDPTPLYVYTTNDKRLAYFAKKLSSFTPLPASKFVEVAAEAKGEQGEIDRPIESYKAFPKGYEIPENTRVVVIESHRYGGDNSTYIKAGETGTTIDKSTCPDVKFDSGILHHNGTSYLDIRTHNLAPLNDRDHPEHPEFGKQKQEEPKSYCEQVTITQAQKDECRKIDDWIFQNPFSNQGELLERNNQLTGQIETMKRLAKIALSNEDYEHMRVILRAIANGEI